MQKDNLFDAQVTPLDVVKVLLLLVTSFSTFNIVSVMTPPSALAWLRELAAVAVVEGAFLGFEYATANAKNKEQVQYSTIGFFVSLAVIVSFALVSGFMEFAGDEMLNTSIGMWMGLEWLAKDAVMIFALVVFVSWLAGLAGIYRLYALADPDKKAELIRLQNHGDVTEKANQALKNALEMAAPVIAVERAMVQIRESYGNELQPNELEEMLAKVKDKLATDFNLEPPTPIRSAVRSIPHRQVPVQPRPPFSMNSVKYQSEVRKPDKATFRRKDGKNDKAGKDK